MPLLRELLHSHSISPLYNNIYTVLLTIAYIKIGFEIASFIRFHVGRKHIPRIFLHICWSSTIIFWPLYDTSDWSWRLNTIAPAAVATRLVYKSILLKDAHDEDVHLISRIGSPSDLIYGPLQLNLLLVYLGLAYFSTPHAVAIVVAAVGVGDSIAPLVGQMFGMHLYRMPLARSKTMEGSVCGVFLGTICGIYFFLYFLGGTPPPLRIILCHAAIAAAVEGMTPMDNVTVPLVLLLTMERVQEWFPISEQPAAA